MAGTYALLTDGGTVEVRPARPQDFEAVRAMHAAMSPDNMYLRFFSMSPVAAEWEAKRVCREPDSDHAALLAWQDGRLAGVGAYELAANSGVAEVAFAVPDDMHGRGIASVLLEHLVWQARQRGLAAFTAETLAENSAMLRVFADVGLPAKRRIAGNTVELTFPLPAGQDEHRQSSYLEAVASRESRADVASLRPLLQPRSVAVVGPSRRRGSMGRAILHNIVTGGFTGPVYAVNPHAPAMEGVPCVASVGDLPGPVDLAVIAVPPAAVPEVAEQCGRHGVRALIVHQLLPGRCGRGTAGRLPPAWHAAARAELFRRDHAVDRPGRHLHRRPPGPRGGRPGGAVRRGGDRAAGADVPAGYRGVLLRVGRRQVRRVPH